MKEKDTFDDDEEREEDDTSLLISDVPTEILQHVFEYLEYKDLIRSIGLINKTWRSALFEDHVWKPKLKQCFDLDPNTIENIKKENSIGEKDIFIRYMHRFEPWMKVLDLEEIDHEFETMHFSMLKNRHCLLREYSQIYENVNYDESDPYYIEEEEIANYELAKEDDDELQEEQEELKYSFPKTNHRISIAHKSVYFNIKHLLKRLIRAIYPNNNQVLIESLDRLKSHQQLEGIPLELSIFDYFIRSIQPHLQKYNPIVLMFGRCYHSVLSHAFFGKNNIRPIKDELSSKEYWVFTGDPRLRMSPPNGQLLWYTSNVPSFVASSFTHWLRRYVDHVIEGVYRVQSLNDLQHEVMYETPNAIQDEPKALDIYPYNSPYGSSATTNFVRITSNWRFMFENQGYAWAYRIRVYNEHPSHSIQVLSRTWCFKDQNGLKKITGDGLIGHQPVIKPGQSFHYTSATRSLQCTHAMWGHFTCIDLQTHTTFNAEIRPYYMFASYWSS